MGQQGIDDSGSTNTITVDHELVHRCKKCPEPIVETSEIEAIGTGLVDRIDQAGSGAIENFVVDDPPADARLAMNPREPGELIVVDPPVFGDDSFDGAVGCRLRDGTNGSDVENLASADGFASTAVAHDESITR